jgi:hypothetical protein
MCSSWRWWWLSLTAVTVLGVSGCGQPAGSVSGKVSYRGKPLKGGSVTMILADGSKSAPATINEDGTYRLDKVLAGPVKVAVETQSLAVQVRLPTYRPPAGTIAAGYAPPDSGGAARRYVRIPPQYADPEKSGLTYTVTAGSQTYDIDLK